MEVARTMNRIVVGIDASRNRSGGAKAHLLGILNATQPCEFGISMVHLWSYNELLEQVPDYPWLIKHCPPELDRKMPIQLLWQRNILPRELAQNGCDILLSTDAGTVCRFAPAVVMSRDMLSFEDGEMERYPICSKARLRLLLLKYVQAASLRDAAGALFLTQYAAEVIQSFTGSLPVVRIIPHGIGNEFRRRKPMTAANGVTKHIRCCYVSNVDLYKHQWHVVTAIAMLRREGYSVELNLIGGGSGAARAMLDRAVAREDPTGSFVTILDNIPHRDIPSQLANADLFIFASSCENMPNTLVEAMAAGLPIACSARGPMPEILGDAGAYFDPEVPASIAQAIRAIISDDVFRRTIARKALDLSQEYSWRRCAQETWLFLKEAYELASKDGATPLRDGGHAS